MFAENEADHIRKTGNLAKLIRRVAWVGYNTVFDIAERVMDLGSPSSTNSDPKIARIRVLFVCYGNVCRSPMAEGVFRQLLVRRGLLGEIYVDSAGTGAHNNGKRPDWRARACLRKRQINIANRRARQFGLDDFGSFDYIVVMDQKNVDAIRQLAPTDEEWKKVSLLLSYLPKTNVIEIDDPIGKSRQQFEQTCALIETGCRAFLEHIAGTLSTA